ncbi:MAG: hypothetical protein IJR55_04480 [Clostridia bacterium]|nr:hypothetical protein [Clostridia bacterium]
MKTPFYPEHYDIIEGVKVYTFFIEPDFPVSKKTVSRKKTVAEKFEDAFCRTVANMILAFRRRKVA